MVVWSWTTSQIAAINKWSRWWLSVVGVEFWERVVEEVLAKQETQCGEIVVVDVRCFLHLQSVR